MQKITKPTQTKMTPEEILGKLFHGSAFTSEVKTAEDNARTLIVKISTINPDRSNDIVEPKGADLTNYLKNPVVLLSHNYQSIPIAKCIDIQIKSDCIIATVLFPEAGVYPVADTVYQMAKAGFINGWSIGFIPTEFTERKDDNGWGYTFTKWQLLEFSAVAVPDNQDALTIMRSKGINVDVLDQEPKVEEAEAALKTLDTAEEKTEEPVLRKIKNVTVDSTSSLMTIEYEDGEEIKAIADEGIVKYLQAREEKAGRTISKKNEDLIKNAITALQSVLSDLEEDDAEGGADEAEEEKAVKAIEKEVTEAAEKIEKDIEESIEEGAKEFTKPAEGDELLKLLAEMKNHIRKSDKHTGLALRNMKELIVIATTEKNVEKGGDK